MLRRFAAFLILAAPVFGQQTYVTRYDIFTGYTYLNSPKISLPEHGFHFQAGVGPASGIPSDSIIVWPRRSEDYAGPATQ